MADYFSLIERAVANLTPDNVSGRAEKYRQAEKALANYLAGMNPPMSAEGVQTEMAALAAACSQVEAKFTGASDAKPDADSAATIRPPNAPPVAVKAPQAPAFPQAPASPQVPPPQVSSPQVSPPQWRPPAQTSTTQTSSAQTQRPSLPESASNASAGTGDEQAPPRRGYMIFLVLGLLAIGATAGVAEFLLPPKPVSKPVTIATTTVHKVKVAPVAPPAAEPAAPAKSTAQVGASDTTAAAPAATPAAAPAADNSAADQTPAAQATQDQTLVASHALLVVQVAPLAGATGNQPTQKGYQGTTTWRVVDVNSAGQPLQKAVVAHAEIPDADVSVKVTIQKNTDKVFPASHTIRVDFKQLPGNTTGAVKVMLMPAMREEAKPAGTPLTGLTTPVLDNHFIVALQDDPNVETKNLNLLKTRAWMDLRVRFANGLVAVFSIEKGTQGDQALAEALKSWGE